MTHSCRLAWCHCWMARYGAIAGCHCSMPGAMVRCHCWVPLLDAIGGGGYDTLSQTRCGAIAGCHGKVPWSLVPLLGTMVGAIAGRHCWMPGAMVSCHCWVPCGRVPLLDAMDGCHLVGIAGCHVVGCHWWMQYTRNTQPKHTPATAPHNNTTNISTQSQKPHQRTPATTPEIQTTQPTKTSQTHHPSILKG